MSDMLVMDNFLAVSSGTRGLASEAVPGQRQKAPSRCLIYDLNLVLKHSKTNGETV